MGIALDDLCFLNFLLYLRHCSQMPNHNPSQNFGNIIIGGYWHYWLNKYWCRFG